MEPLFKEKILIISYLIFIVKATYFVLSLCILRLEIMLLSQYVNRVIQKEKYSDNILDNVC